METKLINKLTKFLLKCGWSELKMHIVIAIYIYIVSFFISIFFFDIENSSYIAFGTVSFFVIIKELLDKFIRNGFFDIFEMTLGIIIGAICCLITNLIAGIYNIL